jgi:hypothetical protein
MHEKRAWFNQAVRPRDAIVIHGNDDKLVSGSSNPHRRQNAPGTVHRGGQKFKSVPINRASHAEAHDGTEHGYTKTNAEKDTRLHVDLRLHVDPEPSVQMCQKAVVPASIRKSANASSDVFTRGRVRAGGTAAHGLKIGEYKSAECVGCSPKVDAVGCGSVQTKSVDTDEKRANNTLAASSSASASQKSESANIHAISARRGINSGTSMRLRPAVFKNNTSTPTQHGESSNRDSKKGKSGSISDQKRVFSAKQIIFSPQTVVCQYRLRNSGGTRIKSVTPGTKPGPRWCPTGLTHTQKRRVQRLRASEIKEDISLKKRDELFSRDRPMMPPNMTWREKRITTEENVNVDNMVADGISKISRDAPIDMDIDKGG